MKNKLNTDCTTQKTGSLPFAPGELERFGLRLTRAEFARFLEVSKQTVGEWVTSGKVTLGIDGLLDPRQAVNQLLLNSNPGRLRSKVLSPLVQNIKTLQNLLTYMEAALVTANKEASYQEAVALEFLGQQDALRQRLKDEQPDLRKLSSYEVINGMVTWLDEAYLGSDDWKILSIQDCIQISATSLCEDASLASLCEDASLD